MATARRAQWVVRGAVVQRRCVQRKACAARAAAAKRAKAARMQRVEARCGGARQRGGRGAVAQCGGARAVAGARSAACAGAVRVRGVCCCRARARQHTARSDAVCAQRRRDTSIISLSLMLADADYADTPLRCRRFLSDAILIAICAIIRRAAFAATL